MPNGAFQRDVGAALAAHQAGQYQQAIRLYRTLLAARPDQADLHNNLGAALKSLGRIDEAEAAYRRAVAIQPDHGAALFNLGEILLAGGHDEEAAVICRQAATIASASPTTRAAAFNNLGVALHRQGRNDEALSAWEDAIGCDPRHTGARLNLAGLLKTLGRQGEAADLCRTIIATAPTAEAFFLLGTILRSDDPKEAVDAFHRSLDLDPTSVAAAMAAGEALNRIGRYKEAGQAFAQAVSLAPDNALAHSNLGSAHYVLGRFDQAIAACREAIRLDPDLAAAHGNLALILYKRDRWTEAEEEFREALRLAPDNADIRLNFGALLQNRCQVSDAAAEFEEALRLSPHDSTEIRSLMLNITYRDDLDHDAQAALHRRLGMDFDRPAAIVPLAPDLAPERKLRIGYVSSDFRGHPVSRNMLPSWRACGRTRFSQYFYAHLADSDKVTDEIRALADGWRDIRSLDDAAVADLIRADGIDILVLLAGRFDYNRPQIACHRPAPIQISLHDVATSGIAEMDYIIGDRWLLPRNSMEYFTERRLRLPQFYLADMPDDLPDLAESRMTGPAIFGSFNLPSKASPRTLTCWGRILAACPDSQLVLRYQGFYNHAEVRARMIDGITAAGAKPDQIIIIRNLESGGDVLGRYNGIDVALDSFPFCGATTSFEALTMGVPVVTRPMDRMVSHWTTAMLSRLGLDELIATSDDDYVAKAIQAGRDADLWRARRKEIRARLAASPMTDGAHWTRHLERLYRAVWRKYCRGTAQAPSDHPVRPEPAPPPVDPTDPARLAAEAMDHQEAGRLDEAIAALRRLIAVRPDFAEAHVNLGNLLKRRGHIPEAIAIYRQAMAARPNDAALLANIGGAILTPDSYGESEQICRRAIALDPNLALAHGNLGAALYEARRWPEAETEFLRAIELAPDDALAHANYAALLHIRTQVREAAPYYEAALAAEPHNPKYLRAVALNAIYRDDLDCDALNALHRRVGAGYERPASPPALTNAPDPGRPLRIGYVSSDFRGHPVTRNMIPFWRDHDRTRFSQYFYAHVEKPDSITSRIRALADEWRDIRDLDDAAAADLIRRDGIDILLLLAGRFDDNRPGIACYRPAPIQISLHDVATSGIEEMDYIIGDRWLIPRDTREYFAERPLRLPQFYVIDMLEDLPDPADTRPPGPPVFASFNFPTKASPRTLACWGRILAALPESRLILQYRTLYSDPVLRSRVRQGILAGGASDEQIVISDQNERHASFMERYNTIDIALDPFPFCGATTSFEALAMGMPVVTRPMGRMVSHWTAAMLSRLGLDELIATSDEDYVAIAVQAGRDADRWRTRRKEIRNRLANSLLTDGARWGRHMERLYRAVWRKYCRDRAAVIAPPPPTPTETTPAIPDPAIPHDTVARLAETANRLYGEGRLADAAETLGQALALDPNWVGGQCDYGVMLMGLGRRDEAIAAYRRAIVLDPGLAMAHSNLAAALLDAGHPDQAAESARTAIALAPNLANAHYNLANALADLERPLEAIEPYRRALAADPASVDALLNLALVLNQVKQWDEALEKLERLVALAPDHAQAHFALGNVLENLQRHDEALAAFRRSLALEPGDIRVHANLATALIAGHRYQEAADICRQALTIDPHATDIHTRLAIALNGQHRFAEAMAEAEIALLADPATSTAGTTLIGSALYREDLDDDAMAEIHRRRADAVPRPDVVRAATDPDPDRKLRIGFVSSDFRSHPVASNLMPAMVRHDRARFSLYFYADLLKFDDVTDEFKALADGWRDIEGLSDAQVARLIRTDAIDILVILAGHFDRNRLPLSVYQAAPIQISLHDAASSGFREIDYIIGDPWLMPRETGEIFTEHRLRLPLFYVRDLPPNLPAVTETRTGPPVFGSFNNPAKLTARVLALWGRILAALPESRLVLKYQDTFVDDDVRRRVLDGLTGAGATPEQVVLLGGTEDGTSFLTRHNDIDVALDPFPFCGSTTSFMALAMGVPVVTRPLDRMVSRWTLAMLHALDLDELVARSDEDYVDIAVRMGRNVATWRARRREIHARLVASPLVDGGRWTRQIERLYRTVWRRYCRARTPDPAEIDRLAAEATDHQRAGRLPDALAALDHLIAAKPDFAQAHANRGAALKGLGRLDEAIAAFARAAALAPDDAIVQSNLGAALLDRGDFAGAEAALDRAIERNPDLPDAHVNLGALFARLGRHRKAMACYEKALVLRPDDLRTRKNLMASALYRDDYDTGTLNAVLADTVKALPGPSGLARPTTDSDPERRLKIGFVSSDFREHPVARNLLSGLTRHHRDRMALCFYSDVTRPDAVTGSFRALAETWRDIACLDDGQVAEIIRSDAIDILVILAGRFDGNRPALARHRAAPLQISLHDVASSGLAEMDYIVGDCRLLPHRSAEFFSERRLCLPHFYLADFPAGAPAIADTGDGPPVFGCFNNPGKIGPRILALWGRILAASPRSRLVLCYRDVYKAPEQRARILAGLQAAGIDEERVEFAVADEPDGVFLARYNRIDVALDTLPFSGSTTTFQALTMGVPVVTRPLDRMVSRWSAALLAPLGLDELIADTDEAYVTIALRIAAEAEAWRKRRGEIRTRLAASPFCDPERWARQMERLYRAIWRKYCRDLRPAPATHPTTITDKTADRLDIARRLLNDAGIAANRGRLDDAVALLRRVLEIRPDFALGYSDLGSLLKNQGKRDEAIAAYRRAIELDPGLAMAHSNLGVALHEAGRLDEAIVAYRAAIAADSDFASARSNLAVALLALDRPEEALATCREATAANPDLAEAHFNLGIALNRLDDPAGAVESLTRATLLKPHYPTAFLHLGLTLKRLKRYDEAAAACRHAIALAPDLPEAYHGLGLVLRSAKRPEEAVEPLRKAMELAPDTPVLRLDLGIALDLAKKWPDAQAVYEEALARGFEMAALHFNLGSHYWRQGRILDVYREYEKAVALDPGKPEYFRGLLLMATYRDDFDVQAMATLHRGFGRIFDRTAVERAATDPDPGRRLRIGFVSSDLHGHPVAGNMLPVFRHHDRAQMSLHFYAQAVEADTMTDSIREQADGWRDITGLSDQAAAELIRSDSIDILVFLAGRFDENRPTIACHRAAPIQINLHDVATSGLAEMDYIIGDRWLIPRDTAEYFSERPLRLPHFYVADFPEDFPEPVSRRGEGPPIFGCFNNPCKIGPRTLALWGRILAALPESRLMLKYLDFYAPLERQQTIRDALVRAGAAPEQVIFVSRMESRREFIARYNAIDVALDTAPFSGSTTSFFALAMGVPVVSQPPDRMVGAWTASMLDALGLGELIAGDDDQYVAIAVKTAHESAGWWARRPDIRARLRASSLCDGARWARQIERLYRAAWRRYCGDAPQPAQRPATAIVAPPPAQTPDLTAPRTRTARELTAEGAIHHRAGRFDEAESLYRRVLDGAPDDPAALLYLGLLHNDRGDAEKAVELIGRAIALDPKVSEAHANLGMALRKLGRTEEAAQSYRRALEIMSDNATIHYNLANLLAAEGRLDEAVDSYRRAVDLAPHIPQCHNGLGDALRRLGHIDEAILALSEALRQQPDFAEAHNGLGACYYDLRDLDRARACYSEAIRLKPDYAEAYKNLGAALYEQGDTDGAIALYRQAITLAPSYVDGHFHLACALLRRGDLAEGWAEYEWRRKLPGFPSQDWPVPEWRGEPLAGRRVVLYGEQGYGDIIQFVRFVPALAATGAHVILCVAPALIRLLSTVEGVAEIVEVNRPLPPFDYHLPLLSLPYRLGVTADTIPGTPYLTADADSVSVWRKRLADLPGRRVGLVWGGNPRRNDRSNWLVDRRRSLTLAAFAPLAGIDGISLVSLQKGEPADQIANPPNGMSLFDPMNEIEDFADTAALISALDLVICVDTSVAHLAGGLGKPVWMLSRFDNCWRWLEGRDDSPWYPSLRLFRQTTPGDWTPVVARLKAALADFAAAE